MQSHDLDCLGSLDNVLEGVLGGTGGAHTYEGDGTYQEV